MLKLDLKTEAYWLELPAKVKLKVKPISTAIMSAAQAMAVQNYQNLKIDSDNESMKKGISESLLVKALAIFAIIEWQGVLKPEADEPAELNEKNICDLMDIWLIAQEFFKQYVTQFKLLEIEGNLSAPAQSGISAVEAHTAISAT